MVPMGTNTDEWIADVASYVRNSFGNTGPLVTPEQVAAVRKAADARSPWTMAELEPTIPTLVANARAVEGDGEPQRGGRREPLTGTGRWDTGAAQRPGSGIRSSCRSQPPSPRSKSTRCPRGRPRRRCRRPGARPAGPPAGFTPGRGRGGPPAAGPVGYRVQISGDGITLERVDRPGTRRDADDRDRVRAGADEIHPHHADRIVSESTVGRAAGAHLSEWTMTGPGPRG